VLLKPFRPIRSSDARLVEIRAEGDYRWSHSIAISADHWLDDLRLSNIEARSVCRACGKRDAAGGRLFCYRLSGLDPTWLYKYQREIADAISDPEIERITMFKAARVAPPLTTGRRAINNLLTARGATGLSRGRKPATGKPRNRGQ
jgi:hypothetical protein